MTIVMHMMIIDEDEDEDVYCTMVLRGVDSNVLLYEYDWGKYDTKKLLHISLLRKYNFNTSRF